MWLLLRREIQQPKKIVFSNKIFKYAFKSTGQNDVMSLVGTDKNFGMCTKSILGKFVLIKYKKK
jgi:hypothetical protein